MLYLLPITTAILSISWASFVLAMDKQSDGESTRTRCNELLRDIKNKQEDGLNQSSQKYENLKAKVNEILELQEKPHTKYFYSHAEIDLSKIENDLRQSDN